MNSVLSKEDIDLIRKHFEYTGYFSFMDDNYESQNWHSNGPCAISEVSFKDLSDGAKAYFGDQYQEKIEKMKLDTSKSFADLAKFASSQDINDMTIRFRWDEEWGDGWPEIMFGDTKISEFDFSDENLSAFWTEINKKENEEKANWEQNTEDYER